MVVNILQVSAMDNYGGAARVAWDLHTAYRRLGHRSWMMVGKSFERDPDVNVFPAPALPKFARNLYQFGEIIKNYKIEWGDKNLGRFFQRLSSVEPVRSWNDYWGVEDFEYPETWKLLDTLGENTPDIIHLHNLHANYFDLRILPALSARYPVVMTLHDAWLLSGHCAHSLDCVRWKTGCGSCPYLSVSPPIKRDATAFNWRRKKSIYLGSRVHVVSPSQWLLDKATDAHSILKPAILSARVIPNGIDLSVFRPAPKAQARQELNISQDAFVLLFVAAGSRAKLSQKDLYKDYATIQSALEVVSSKIMKSRPVVFMALGGKSSEETYIGKTLVKFLPYVNNAPDLVKYYQASDVYLHAAYAETFPTVILEAMACGVPVIVTAVGGIVEQVLDGVTGFLVDKFDAHSMAVRILELVSNDELRNSMGRQAVSTSHTLWGADRMVENYLSYYQEILSGWRLDSKSA